MTCPRCGAANPPGELLCQRCGRTLPQMPAEEYQSSRDAEARQERRKWRRDLAVSATVAIAAALLTLLLADAAPPDTAERYAGQQLWWLFGLLWGGVFWFVRRTRG